MIDLKELERAFAQNARDEAARQREKAEAARRTERERIGAEKARKAARKGGGKTRPAHMFHPENAGLTEEQVEARYAALSAGAMPAPSRAPARRAAAGGRAKAGSKTARLLEAVRRPGGATLAEICEHSGFDERNARTTMNILKARQGLRIAARDGRFSVEVA